MKRYCIEESSPTSNNKIEQQDAIVTGHSELSFYPFTVYDLLVNKDKENLFPECQDDINSFIEQSTNTRNLAQTEAEMYGDILLFGLDEDLIELDMAMHIYYTMLYHRNETKYIPFMKEEWSSEQKENIRDKRKSCRRYEKRLASRRECPFEIIEEREQNCIKILDFAPEIVRLYYSSGKFRNIFKDILNVKADKYRRKEIINITKNNTLVEISRIEEIWLYERLIGLNIADTWYSFWRRVLNGIEYTNIEKEYADIIEKLIKAVMKWKGIYSRNLIVERLKLIYEIMLNVDREMGEKSRKQVLEKLFESVSFTLKNDVDFETVEREIYTHLTWSLEEVKTRAEELVDKKLICRDRCFHLKRNYENIIPKEDSEKELFALIYKTIIKNLNQ